MNKERILIHYCNGGLRPRYELYNDTISINRKYIKITRSRKNMFDCRIIEKSICRYPLEIEDVDVLYENVRYILVNKIGKNKFHTYVCDGDCFDFIVYDEAGNIVVTNAISTNSFETETFNTFRHINKYYDNFKNSISKKGVIFDD